MKIICTLNLKGGCAKTTTAVSMAELLATGFKSKRGAVEPGPGGSSIKKSHIPGKHDKTHEN